MIFVCDLQLAGKREQFFCKRPGRVVVDLALCCKCWTMLTFKSVIKMYSSIIELTQKIWL